MTLPATIHPDDASRERWDVIVIGAGPAGALAAREAARRRLKTLLVDRRAFPRTKVCGSCLSRRALSLLEHAGLSRQVEALKGVPLERADVLMKSQSLTVSLPGGAAISRADLDAMLVMEAIAEGAAFLPQTTACVRPHMETGGTRTVELAGPQGTPVLLNTSAVVAADGLGHPSLRSCPEFADLIERRSRLGLGTTLATDVSGFDPGRVTMAVGRCGYVGAVRLRGGELHLAASVDQTALRENHEPAVLVSQILNETHLPLPDLASADWQGTLPLTRRSRSAASNRIFLAGDAAGYVEPFTGEGIAWALTTGMAVASFVEQAVRRSSPQAEQDWRAAYRRLIHQRQDWCRLLAWLLRRPRVASMTIRCLGLWPDVPQFLVNQLNRPLAATEWDFA